MKVVFSNEKNCLTVKISGEIDHHTALLYRIQIDERLKKAHPKKLVLDFSNVTFMDTSGIGLILGRFKLSKTLGVKMKVVKIPEKMKKIVVLSGLQSMGILE